jgi:hypothetical protein
MFIGTIVLSESLPYAANDRVVNFDHCVYPNMTVNLVNDVILKFTARSILWAPM